jgi:signal peptidase I
MTDQGGTGGSLPPGDGAPPAAPPSSPPPAAPPPFAPPQFAPPAVAPAAEPTPDSGPGAAPSDAAADPAAPEAPGANASAPSAASDPTSAYGPTAAAPETGEPQGGEPWTGEPQTQAMGSVPPAVAGDAANGRAYTGRRRAPKAGKKQKTRRKAPWWELPGLVLLAIVIAILVKTFIVQPFYIPSESMEKTLHGCPGCHGDRILVNKLIYDFRDPHPGDIVVFDAPPGWDEPSSKPPSNPIVKTIRGFGQLIGFVPPDGQVLVKRVIATGGQTVKGDAKGNVMVSTKGPNGPFRTLHEPYTYMPGPAASRAFGAVTVPKGRLWVMGDHRNDSADSRYHCGNSASDSGDDSACDPETSTVPVHDVIGKAFVIAWPPSRWRTLGTPSTFKSAALAAASDVPAFVSGAVLLPVFAVRRRRRRR